MVRRLGAVGRPLFAAGHSLSEFFIRHETWERSLLYNLLLQDGIAAPDHSLLGARHTGIHLAASKERHGKTGRSWLEAGLWNRDLTVHLRADSFEEATKVYRKTAIRGQEGEFVGPLAKRLDGWLENGQLDVKRWPDASSLHLGREYQLLTQRELGNESPKWFDFIEPYEAGRSLVDFWTRRVEWRTEWIHEATQRGDGLMISRLLDVASERVFSELGISKSHSSKVETISGLIEIGRKSAGKSFTDATLPDDLALYFKIICELYNRNHAKNLTGCRHNRVVDDPFTALGSQTHASFAAPEEDETDGYHELAEIKLPTVAALLEHPGAALVKIKSAEREKPDNYFHRLDAWLENSNEENSHLLAEGLSDYASDIVKTINGETETLSAGISEIGNHIITGVAGWQAQHIGAREPIANVLDAFGIEGTSEAIGIGGGAAAITLRVALRFGLRKLRASRRVVRVSIRAWSGHGLAAGPDLTTQF